ncbi:Uncharacterised protein [Actinobaculum suis]|uniref:Uncharacterized protein n=1 Tax=Actinobaculum suis TaxID=1657 RepID=A0A7Z9C969_9ACTO|nr:Uncharacterised protein [Actinobaculum suis]
MAPNPARHSNRPVLKTNPAHNRNEAVTKECFGPDTFYLRVYDINGVEILRAENTGSIEGNNCRTGLMKGETGTWRTAFNGPDSEFGWAVFEDYEGEESIVTLDPNLELRRETSY